MPSTINEDRIIALTRALRGLPSSTLSAMLVSVLSGDPFRYEVEGQVLSQGKFMSDEQNVETSKYDEHHTDHGKIIDRAGKGVCENCGEEYRFEENGRGRCGVHSKEEIVIWSCCKQNASVKKCNASSHTSRAEEELACRKQSI